MTVEQRIRSAIETMCCERVAVTIDLLLQGAPLELFTVEEMMTFAVVKFGKYVAEGDSEKAMQVAREKDGTLKITVGRDVWHFDQRGERVYPNADVIHPEGLAAAGELVNEIDEETTQETVVAPPERKRGRRRKA